MVTDVMTDEEGFALAEVLRERGEGTIQLTYAPIGKESLADMFNVEPVLRWSEQLAEISGRPVLHNLVQSADGMPEMHRGLLAWLASCHERGLSVYGQGETNRNFQQFDFTTWNGFDIAPGWKAALMGTPEERLANLRNPDMRAAMLADRPWLMAIEGLGMKLEAFDVVGAGGAAAVEPYVGRQLGEIAAAEGKDVLEVMIDLAIASELKVELRSPLVRVPNAEYTAEMMRSGHVVPGISDGGAHTKYFVGGTYTTDLLTWLVRDTETLTLEQAHFALSALPARIAGIKQRGTLVEGAPADIVVYDLERLKQVPEGIYETIDDVPGGDWRRVRRAEGYRWTIVNGQVTFVDGECTGATPGRLLRNGRG
jgi:N-acyl-D-aspartate/D-glutamate deacylase